MERYTPAHTDSDVSVFFTDANVIHTGDTWFNNYFPFIDYNTDVKVGRRFSPRFNALG